MIQPNILLSVIMPVYNVERYLRKSIESVLNQTYRQWELIAIDDGSTDSSGAILDECALHIADSRFKIFHQKNQGLSATRNFGLKHASGQYVFFFDADDLLESDLLFKSMQILERERADLVLFPYKEIDDKGEALQQKNDQFFDIQQKKIRRGNDLLLELLKDHIKNYAWQFIFRKSIATAHSIAFPENRYFEDIATTHKFFYYAGKARICTSSHYLYRIRKNSIVNSSLGQKNINDFIASSKDVYRFYQNNGQLKKYVDGYYMSRLYECYRMIARKNLFYQFQPQVKDLTAKLRKHWSLSSVRNFSVKQRTILFLILVGLGKVIK
ncbi:glycosyltransferase family 2 protein [Oenococcus alcoholitolerans]|uniref:glycosyltransferase family 2 protein n=1 Tax=Oenococcus alcoholitolerans TaxID=931074 RepID=UPI003F6E4569